MKRTVLLQAVTSQIKITQMKVSHEGLIKLESDNNGFCVKLGLISIFICFKAKNGFYIFK